MTDGHIYAGIIDLYNQTYPLQPAFTIDVSGDHTGNLFEIRGLYPSIAYMTADGKHFNVTSEQTVMEALWGNWNTFQSAVTTGALISSTSLGMGSIIQDSTSPTAWCYTEIAPRYVIDSDTYSASIDLDSYSNFSLGSKFTVVTSSKNTGHPIVPTSARMRLTSDSLSSFVMIGTDTATLQMSSDNILTMDLTSGLTSTHQGPYFIVNPNGDESFSVNKDAVRIGGDLPGGHSEPTILEPMLYIRQNNKAGIYIDSDVTHAALICSNGVGLSNAIIRGDGAAGFKSLAITGQYHIYDEADLDGSEGIIFIHTSGSSYNINLPDTNSVALGQMITFKMVEYTGGDVVTILPYSDIYKADTIDGDSDYTIDTAYQKVTLICSDLEWVII
jgi:hypothetical protein